MNSENSDADDLYGLLNLPIEQYCPADRRKVAEFAELFGKQVAKYVPFSPCAPPQPNLEQLASTAKAIASGAYNSSLQKSLDRTCEQMVAFCKWASEGKSQPAHICHALAGLASVYMSAGGKAMPTTPQVTPGQNAFAVEAESKKRTWKEWSHWALGELLDAMILGGPADDISITLPRRSKKTTNTSDPPPKDLPTII